MDKAKSESKTSATVCSPFRWHRYLNCGFRLTATAGTDKMTAFVTVGANRVFARVDGDFTYQAWIDALKAGHTFVTNSPVLQLAVNGQEPGATIHMGPNKSGVAEILASADSQLPYHRLEIVCNGRVIAETSPSGPRYRAEIRLERPIRGSCWVVARALEDIDPYRKAGFKFTTVHAQSRRQACLGPHYIRDYLSSWSL